MILGVAEPTPLARIPPEKLAQAGPLVQAAGFDLWLTFVRETAGGSDPVLPFLIEGGLTWTSALMVAQGGETVAIVGNYDADPLVASGDWDEVVPYVESIRDPLLAAFERFVGAEGRIAVNYSRDDPKGDGLTHGLWLSLEELVRGTRFAGRFDSSARIVGPLRGRKTPTELDRIEAAIAAGDEVFVELGRRLRVGMSKREVYALAHMLMAERGLGCSWDPAGDPIVNSGPDSRVGHAVPSTSVTVQPGHLVHIDLGVTRESYSSDVQRCWFVGPVVPSDVEAGLRAVNGAIDAAADALRPGVPGWRVDQAARQAIVEAGYPEYLHAVGHQVGRLAHDGGTILGPRWERYGSTPLQTVEAGEVYTLELGVTLPERGYLGIEEMVTVTGAGCRFLTERQTEMWVLDGSAA